MTLSYIFWAIKTPKGGVLRPLMPVRLQYKTNKPIDILMLLDSGADFSMLPRSVGEGLGVPCDVLPTTVTTGVSGECSVGETTIYITFGQRGEIYEYDMPVQIQLDEKVNFQPVLGRVPLFYDFDIAFRMGYCEGKGKFTLSKIKRRREPSKYPKTPLLGT
jgi:hypothetical protein